VLAHLYPEADIPVVQVSIDARAPFETHMKIGAALAPLLDEGVMVVGSGNVVHNLSLIDWSQPTTGFDWAHQFDEEVRRIVTTSPADLPPIQHHELFKRVAPTPEHFMPLLYLAGISLATGTPLYSFAEGCAYGSLSMTSYVLRG
jgi:4,5-DOPA dioxygenase extradiol